VEIKNADGPMLRSPIVLRSIVAPARDEANTIVSGPPKLVAIVISARRLPVPESAEVVTVNGPGFVTGGDGGRVGCTTSMAPMSTVPLYVRA
jgi:hypothetical protein